MKKKCKKEIIVYIVAMVSNLELRNLKYSFIPQLLQLFSFFLISILTYLLQVYTLGVFFIFVHLRTVRLLQFVFYLERQHA